MEKVVSVQCGSKRNFDVAFLSGENDIDKNGKKKEMEETEQERQTQKEHSPLGLYLKCELISEMKKGPFSSLSLIYVVQTGPE